MFQEYQFYNHIENYISLFGVLFHDISITKTDSNNNITQALVVPLSYADKDKMLAAVLGDPNLDKSIGIELPRMAFNLVSFQYDPSRKIGSTVKILNSNTANQSTVDLVYSPVPYNMKFELSIWTKNNSDAAKIVEQIIPYFTPDWTLKASIIPTIPQTYDIPIILDSVVKDNTLGNTLKDKQTYIWDLGFTMKGYFFQPTKQKPIIKYTNVSVFDLYSLPSYQANSANVHYETLVTVQPGLTANGQPTSNIAQSIPASQIQPNSNFGYITTITENY